MARFGHRPKRISRRSERQWFEHVVMPAVFLCFPVGVAILVAAALAYLIYGGIVMEMLVLGGMVFAIPGLLHVYRFVRGHFSRELDEP